MLTQISALLGIKQAIWGQLSEIFSRRFVSLFLLFVFFFLFFFFFKISSKPKPEIKKRMRDFMKHKSVLVKNNLILHSNFSTSKYR